MHPFLIYALAAGAEIGGCYIVWGWLRLGYGPLWLVPGVALLILFAGLLTLIPELSAGRTFAAYGGVYIVASLVWMWAVESIRPDRFDLIGASVCLLGAAIILLAPRAG